MKKLNTNEIINVTGGCDCHCNAGGGAQPNGDQAMGDASSVANCRQVCSANGWSYAGCN